MTRRRARVGAVAGVALVGLVAVGCADKPARPGRPVCGPLKVAEWERGDGWECEPDRNRNGIDDEDERGRTGARTALRPTFAPTVPVTSTIRPSAAAQAARPSQAAASARPPVSLEKPRSRPGDKPAGGGRSGRR